mgnify:CR=1 FL=1
MTDPQSLFHFEEGQQSFEDLARPNGGTYWFEDDMRQAMGYTDADAFRRVIVRAMQACLSIGIMTEDSFVRTDDGSSTGGSSGHRIRPIPGCGLPGYVQHVTESALKI